MRAHRSQMGLLRSTSMLLLLAVNSCCVSTAEDVADPTMHAADPTCSKNHRMLSFDDRFGTLIDTTATLETLASGFLWLEGPAIVSDGSDEAVVFSDVKANKAFVWQNDTVNVFMDPSGCLTVRSFVGRLAWL